MPLPPVGPLATGQKRAKRAKVYVEVTGVKTEVLAQFGHATLERHQRQADPVDLVIRQVSDLNPPQCLPFHELTKQLDYRQHQANQATFNRFRVRVDSPGRGGWPTGGHRGSTRAGAEQA